MKIVHWHRDLPPLDAEILHEHVLEAKSDRVSGLAAGALQLRALSPHLNHLADSFPMFCPLKAHWP
jgi:hypothetical protein